MRLINSKFHVKNWSHSSSCEFHVKNYGAKLNYTILFTTHSCGELWLVEGCGT